MTSDDHAVIDWCNMVGYSKTNPRKYFHLGLMSQKWKASDLFLVPISEIPKYFILWGEGNLIVFHWFFAAHLQACLAFPSKKSLDFVIFSNSLEFSRSMWLLLGTIDLIGQTLDWFCLLWKWIAFSYLSSHDSGFHMSQIKWCFCIFWWAFPLVSLFLGMSFEQSQWNSVHH